MKFHRVIATLLACVLFASPLAMAQQSPPVSTSSGASTLSFVAGKFIANEYKNYGGDFAAAVYQGNAATGSSTITIRGGYIVLRDGRSIVPYAVGVPIVINDATPELITPTSVSGCYKSQGQNQDGITVTCTITASFANLHYVGATVGSATGGAAEAANDAFNWGGGIVVLAPGFGINTSCTGCYTNVANMMANLLPYANVSFEDDRGPSPTYWNVLPSTTSYLAAPATLTSSTVSSSTTVAGSASYTGGTIHVCIAYVDIMGNEGPCSADYSFADTSAQAIQFSAPAASTGAVGWIPYIGLESGASGHEYQMKLVTQPTVLGSNPVTNGVCTLTALETITPACAVSNTLYGQSSSGTVNVTAYPVVTSPQAFQLGGVSSTSYYVPNVNAHTTYAYVPGAHLALNGVVSSSEPFTVSATLASTVPFVLGSIALPPNFMNYQGRTVKVCGFVTDAATDVDTITAIQFWWDAQGSNVTTGIPVKLANDQVTQTLTASTNRTFCQTFVTTVASASATGGTIQSVDGWIAESQVAAGTIHVMSPNITTAAVGSLNLAESARLDIVFVETTSTVDTPQLQNVTVQILN